LGIKLDPIRTNGNRETIIGGGFCHRQFVSIQKIPK
jgi:hypothetical protein